MLLYRERNCYIIPLGTNHPFGQKEPHYEGGTTTDSSTQMSFFFELVNGKCFFFFSITARFEISSFRESFLAYKLYDLHSTEFSHYKRNITKCILIFKEIWDTDSKIKQVNRIPFPAHRQERGLVMVLAPFAGRCEPTSQWGSSTSETPASHLELIGLLFGKFNN